MMIICNFVHYVILNIASLLGLLLMLLVGVAFLTLLERKLLGYVQYRKGPNKLGFMGIMQPFSDAIKLFNKELFYIFKSNQYIYYLCPIVSFLMMLVIWMVYPFITNIYFMNYSMLFLILVMSISGYILLMMGWSSNSTYSLLGALRSVAQTLSYEVSFIFMVLVLMLMSESYSLMDFSKWQVYMWYLMYMFPVFVMFFVSVLAELNRSPMDFIEGESELVSGFNIEYFSGGFALILWVNMVKLFFKNVNMFFVYKYKKSINNILYINMFCMLIIFMRGLLPRMRYDELMYLCWKIILPLVLNYLVMIFSF
uniref:NADH-ubiquinone oxidoreductase chain 1 n=1 Tax=Linepithema humile TaxID=83485 RepID=A0A0S2A3A4_LINHU|nr:NADH dehydrogenase subunit 1 [Linepithema humile]